MTTNIEQTLETRGSNYGSFLTQANLTQAFEQLFKQHYSAIHPDQPLPPFMAEALHMIFHKTARIANGNPFYDDSWHDIAGYAQLVVDIIHQVEASKKEQEEEEAENTTLTGTEEEKVDGTTNI